MLAALVKLSRADLVAVVVASLAFATSGPLGKLCAGVSPVTIAAVRTGVASLVLVLVMPRVFARSLAALDGPQRRIVVAAGALLAGHFTLWFAGLARTSLAAAVALISLEPLAVVGASFVWHGLRPSRRELLGLLVAVLGAAVVASGAGVGEHHLAGDLLVFGCVILYGVYVAAARRLRDAMPAIPYVAAVYGSAALLLAPLAILTYTPSLSRQAWVALGGIVLLPTLVGHTLMNVTARRAPPVVAALVCPGETLGALALASFAMGTPPTLREALGAVVVLVGATVATLPPPRVRSLE